MNCNFVIISVVTDKEYVHTLDKKWTLGIEDISTGDTHQLKIGRVACGFSAPKLSWLIERIESRCSSWKQILDLDQSSLF